MQSWRFTAQGLASRSSYL